jgi:hypothetical protein
MKESYDNMTFLLTMIQYEKYSWCVCGDLKVIALLLKVFMVRAWRSKGDCSFIKSIHGTCVEI